MHRRRWGLTRLLLPFGVGAVAALGGWALAGAATGSGVLSATFVKVSDWGSGYVAAYDIANGGSPIKSWTLSFTVVPGQTVTNSWNGTVTQSGTHYVVTSATWNGALATGATAQLGFQASYSGTFVAPSDCLINDQPCGGRVGGTTTTTAKPPPPPTTTTVPSTTTTTKPPPPPTTTTVPSTTTTTTVPVKGAASLSATFTKTSDWGNGFVAAYTVADGGVPVSAWTLRFTLPANEAITGAWSGTMTESGSTYTVTNATWNGNVGPGVPATFGFQGTYSGTFVAPTNCTINGAPCSAGSGPGSGGTGTGTGTGSGPLPPLPAGAAFPFAPYVDATVDYPPFTLVNDQKQTGTKYFTLGFVVSENGCQASWGGYYPVSSGYYQPQIQALRGVGGDVIVSFGGAAGNELADACTSVAALEAQYQAVVTKYDVSHIDFDIEGADEGNTASLDRRFQAIALLEAANPNLSVSLTLPVLPTGLDATGLGVLKAAIAEGTRVDLVNVMAMDYGDGPAPAPAGKMGAYAIDAAQGAHGQLQTLYPTLSSAQVWKMVGVTPLLGVNDATDEIFGPSDAQQLVNYADQVHLGRLAMWAATRDVECSGGAQTYSSDTCSSVIQQPFAFSKIFATFVG